VATQKNFSKRPDAHCVARCLSIGAAEPTNGITLSPASSPEPALPAGHPATSPSPHPLRLRRGWGLSSWRTFGRVNPRNTFVHGLLCLAGRPPVYPLGKRPGEPSKLLPSTNLVLGDRLRLFSPPRGVYVSRLTDDSLRFPEPFLDFLSSSDPIPCPYPSLLFTFTCTKFVLLASSSPCLLTSCGSGHCILYRCPL